MKPSELKSLMKECMREVLREEGLIKETAQVENKHLKMQQRFNESMAPARPLLNDGQRKLVQEMKSKKVIASAFDPFAGTAPLTENAAEGGPMEPPDGGVKLNDLSSLLGNSHSILKALEGGKK